jgi:RNA polymerase sigma-70 factor (ECF subfamily)
METAATDRLDQLITDSRWLRGLARSLVKDAAAADDIVQDAWLVATERLPDDDRPLRPWLARVVLNLARMRGRSTTRRIARELGAGDHMVPPMRPDEIVERVETQRMLAGLVLELGEPYRDVLLLHYFEGLPSPEIGRRLGVSDGTVRWRLKHALDELRARLAGRSGDQRAWIAPIAALAGGPVRGAAGGLMTTKLITVTAALALLAIVIVIAITADTSGDQGSTAARPTSKPIALASERPSTAVPMWLVQTGAPSRRIAGRVVVDGAPVVGVPVALRMVEQPDLAIADAVAGADGTFALGERLPAVYQVIASAPGRSPAIVEVDTRNPLAHPDQLVLALGGCASRASGTVTDAARVPIEHALVQIEDLVGIETDASGAYDLCRGAAATMVTVAADGYGTVRTTFSVLGAERRDIMLVPESILVGRIVLADSRAPVADARISITPVTVSRANPLWSRPPIVSSARSDSDGRFQVGGLASGRFQISAAAPGLGSVVLDTWVDAGTSKQLTVAMTARSRVYGRVMANGSPLLGARVTAVTAGNVELTAWSQADGGFVLDGLPHGMVRWEVRGYDIAGRATSRIDQPEAHVMLQVAPGTLLRGRVTSRGIAVGGAEVTWTQLDRRRRTTSDPDGHYLLDGIAPGTAAVLATGPTAFARPRQITLAVGTTELDIDLDQYASASGTVVNQDGKPVPEVYVVFDLNGDIGEGMTDATGHFQLGSMAGGGDYLPSVYPSPAPVWPFAGVSGGQLARVRLADAHAAVTGIVLTIRDERLTIRGRVLDDSGVAVPDVRVEALVDVVGGPRDMQGAGMLGAGRLAVTDLAGRFELRGLPPGSYNLYAYGADGSQGTAREITAGSSNVVITLPEAGGMEGTITGFGETPIIMIEERGHRERAVVSDGGRFAVHGLQPGTYAVSARDATGGDAQAVEVRAGSVTHVELRSRGTGRIEGWLGELGSGVPVGDVPCTATPTATSFAPTIDGDATGFTDATGHFTIDAPAGRVRLWCRPLLGPWGAADRDLIVITGGVVQTELRLVHRRSTRPVDIGFNMLIAELPPTIARVVPDSAVARAGLAANDQIISIDGTPLDDLGIGGITLLLEYPRGATAVLGVLRGRTHLTIPLVIE